MNPIQNHPWRPDQAVPDAFTNRSRFMMPRGTTAARPARIRRTNLARTPHHPVARHRRRLPTHPLLHHPLPLLRLLPQPLARRKRRELHRPPHRRTLLRTRNASGQRPNQRHILRRRHPDRTRHRRPRPPHHRLQALPAAHRRLRNHPRRPHQPLRPRQSPGLYRRRHQPHLHRHPKLRRPHPQTHGAQTQRRRSLALPATNERT